MNFGKARRLSNGDVVVITAAGFTYLMGVFYHIVTAHVVSAVMDSSPLY